MKHWIEPTMRQHLVYRGHMIERIGPEWRIYRNKALLHTTPNQTAAMEWVDQQRAEARQRQLDAERRKQQ